MKKTYYLQDRKITAEQQIYQLESNIRFHEGMIDFKDEICESIQVPEEMSQEQADQERLRLSIEIEVLQEKIREWKADILLKRAEIAHIERLLIEG